MNLYYMIERDLIFKYLKKRVKQTLFYFFFFVGKNIDR